MSFCDYHFNIVAGIGEEAINNFTASRHEDAIYPLIRMAVADKPNANYHLYPKSSAKSDMHNGVVSGIESWVKPYPKPLIRNHNTDLSPDGRIIAAGFRANPRGGARTPMVGMPGYEEGTGYFYAVAKVSNPECVDKILRGEFQSVSIGVRALSVKCSITGEDPLEQLRAGNWPQYFPGSKISDENGDTYCVWIAQKWSASELSFVNVPAESTAMVLDLDIGKEKAEKFLASDFTNTEYANDYIASVSKRDFEFFELSSQNLVQVFNVPEESEEDLWVASIKEEPMSKELEKKVEQLTDSVNRLVAAVTDLVFVEEDENLEEQAEETQETDESTENLEETQEEENLEENTEETGTEASSSDNEESTEESEENLEESGESDDSLTESDPSSDTKEPMSTRLVPRHPFRRKKV